MVEGSEIVMVIYLTETKGQVKAKMGQNIDRNFDWFLNFQNCLETEQAEIC